MKTYKTVLILSSHTVLFVGFMLVLSWPHGRQNATSHMDGEGRPTTVSIPWISNAFAEDGNVVPAAVSIDKETRQGDAPRVFEEQTSEPAEANRNLHPQEDKRQSGIPGVRLAGGLFSVDVKNINLLKLFEDLGTRCDIDILGKHVLSNQVISAKFHDVNLQDGIRRLIRIAGIENYALTYRNDTGTRYALSQIFFLPEGVQPSKPYHLAKRKQKVSIENTDFSPKYFGLEIDLTNIDSARRSNIADSLNKGEINPQTPF